MTIKLGEHIDGTIASQPVDYDEEKKKYVARVKDTGELVYFDSLDAFADWLGFRGFSFTIALPKTSAPRLPSPPSSFCSPRIDDNDKDNQRVHRAASSQAKTRSLSPVYAASSSPPSRGGLSPVHPFSMSPRTTGDAPAVPVFRDRPAAQAPRSVAAQPCRSGVYAEMALSPALSDNNGAAAAVQPHAHVHSGGASANARLASSPPDIASGHSAAGRDPRIPSEYSFIPVAAALGYSGITASLHRQALPVTAAEHTNHEHRPALASLTEAALVPVIPIDTPLSDALRIMSGKPQEKVNKWVAILAGEDFDIECLGDVRYMSDVAFVVLKTKLSAVLYGTLVLLRANP